MKNGVGPTSMLAVAVSRVLAPGEFAAGLAVRLTVIGWPAAGARCGGLPLPAAPAGTGPRAGSVSASGNNAPRRRAGRRGVLGRLLRMCGRDAGHLGWQISTGDTGSRLAIRSRRGHGQPYSGTRTLPPSGEAEASWGSAPVRSWSGIHQRRPTRRGRRRGMSSSSTTPDSSSNRGWVGRERAVSRVLFPRSPGGGGHLSRAPVARPLQRPLPEGSASSLPPGRRTVRASPSYLVLLRAGFTWPAGHPAAGGLLPHHFTLAG